MSFIFCTIQLISTSWKTNFCLALSAGFYEYKAMRNFSLSCLLALIPCWDQILKWVYTDWTWVPWSVLGIVSFKWKWVSGVQGCFQSSPLKKNQLKWRSLIKFLIWFFFLSVSLPTNNLQSIILKENQQDVIVHLLRRNY